MTSFALLAGFRAGMQGGLGRSTKFSPLTRIPLTAGTGCDCVKFYNYLMSNTLINFLKYLRGIEVTVETLRSLVAGGNAASPLPAPSEATIINEIPEILYQGQVEPFSLTVKQLEIARACCNDVPGFLQAPNGTEPPLPGQPEQPQPIRPTDRPGPRKSDAGTRSRSSTSRVGGAWPLGSSWRASGSGRSRRMHRRNPCGAGASGPGVPAHPAQGEGQQCPRWQAILPEGQRYLSCNAKLTAD